MTPIFDQLVKEFYGEVPRTLRTVLDGGGIRTAVHWLPVPAKSRRRDIRKAA